MYYRIIDNSIPAAPKKAPLNNLIRSAKQVRSAAPNEASLLTLNKLRDALFSGVPSDELEETRAGRRFLNFLERAAGRI